jgi:hypothetical protein
LRTVLGAWSGNRLMRMSPMEVWRVAVVVIR